MAYRGEIRRAQWGARPPKSVSPMRGTGQSIGHWVGTGIWGPLWYLSHDSCAAKVRSIQNVHMSGPYADIAYNHLPCPHGYVFEGRGLGVANGASGTTLANTTRHAFCALVGQGDPIGEMGDLFDAINAVLTGYAVFGGANPHGAGCHSDVVSTACPGPNVCLYCRGWRLGLHLPTPTPPPAAEPIPTDWHAIRRALANHLVRKVGGGPVLRMGSTGTPVSDWQHSLNLTVGANLEPDGIFGRLTREKTAGFQYVAGITVDGVVGRQSRNTMVSVLSRV